MVEALNPVVAHTIRSFWDLTTETVEICRAETFFM